MVQWFDVSKDGLAKLLERRGKSWILGELLQNAWDAPGVAEVQLNLMPIKGRPLAELSIIDDSPIGFTKLEHAFTIFGESEKKQHANLRGRFNLGEKLVLALCDQAIIETTIGSVSFTADSGRQVFPRRRRDVGTQFRAIIRMTRDEVEEALAFARSFIAPAGINTLINDQALLSRSPIGSFEMSLQTELADAEGVLRRGRRRTSVSVYRPHPGLPGRIYEMGIPIMDTGDTFDVDIGQKVPLSLDRDVVTPAYLRDVRVGVLNALSAELSDQEANQSWVADALEAKDIGQAAVVDVISRRFGPHVVSYDPSDREANDKAIAQGYKVLHGGSLTAAAWENVRASGFVRPAGQVTPSPRPFDPNGAPAVHVAQTPGMARFSQFCKLLGRRVLDAEIEVNFLERFNALAAYGPGSLSFNIGRLGKAWFEGDLRQEQVDLVIHEFGHHFEMNHLSKNYNDALTRIGAAVTMAALAEPDLFDLRRHGPELDQDDLSP